MNKLLILRYALAFVLGIFLLYQVRKPSRWVGRFFLWIMNMSHSKLTDWGLAYVEIAKNFIILDVGCGGGRTIHKLTGFATEGKVYGIDYANGSVAASRANNRQSITTERVEILKASVSQLPFPENQFDLVTAIETLYYWPDPSNDIREILRVLRPGGVFIVISETYRHHDANKRVLLVMKSLRARSLSADEHRQLFLNAGYEEIEIFEERTHGWICCKAKKPSKDINH